MPSEELRRRISQQMHFDLNMFAIEGDLLSSIKKIPLDRDYEDHPKLHTLGDSLERGLNIGRCGLTSRYLLRVIPDGDLIYGKCVPLIGTPSSPNGNHAWVQTDNLLIDPTLLVAIPLQRAYALGYTPERVIAKESATLLSEYDTYSSELRILERRALQEAQRAMKPVTPQPTTPNRDEEKRLCFVRDRRKYQVG